MVEREWREASDLKPTTLWLAVAVLGGGLLRFWALGQGIPFAPGIDEPQIVDRVMRMMRTGDFNPHFFDYPGLIFYMHLPVACLRFIVGASQGAWANLNSVSSADFYLWARALTATLGTATVLLVHQIGMRWGARHALLAATLMAVMPMHVRESHFVLTDVPMTFFVALTLLQTLRAAEHPSIPAFALAGAAAGLATGVKYNAGVVLLTPILAAWASVPRGRERFAALGAVLAAWAATFLVVAPYTVLDLPRFLNDFAYLVYIFRDRPPGVEPGIVIYLKHLRLGLGWPASLLLVGGIVMGLIRSFKGPGRLRWALLIVFPVAYLWVIANRNQIYGRYLLPVVPFATVLVAAAVVSGVSLLRRFDIPRAVRTTLIVGLTVAALLPPLTTSINFVRNASRPSTLQSAWVWLQANVPPRSKIVIEGFELRLPADKYQVEHVARLTDRAYEAYKTAGVQYLIASSGVYGRVLRDPAFDPNRFGVYSAIFAQGRDLARVTPSARRPGPELRIIEVR